MLMFAGIVSGVLAVAVFLLIGFAQGMSTTGQTNWRDQWPAGALALVSILCFVARHWLHGKSITW